MQLRVSSDMLVAAHAQGIIVWMLDLSAAYECVDDAILLQRFHIGVRLKHVVAEWISSFMS